MALSEKAVVGCLLGTTVGDALGLSCENLSPRRIRRRFPQLDRYHFFFGRGMTSDDTEHTCMVGQALLSAGNEVEGFRRNFARRLRWWLLGLPAGIGRATLRSILKLWVGFSPQNSGVFSAGNGPAMRSALLGVCVGHDAALLTAMVRASTRITHTDPKAEHGALATALAAHISATDATWKPTSFQQRLTTMLGESASEFLELVEKAVRSASAGETTEAFVKRMGWKRGISGYTYHTVPAVLQTWFRRREDFAGGVQELIACGGDTDTTAAIFGGIVGACVGKEGIPPRWLERLWEWPRSVGWMERLGRRLVEAEGKKAKPLRLFVPGLLLRNVFFLTLVVLHVLRRLLPPY